MEHGVNCPICNSQDSKATEHPLYKQCLACSGVYQFKEVKPVDDYYENIGGAPDFSHQVGSYKSYISIIERVVKPDDRLSLVDMGAGDGTFLEVCRRRLRLKNYYAVEKSKIALNALKQKNIETIERLKGIRNKIVVCLQVIEHTDKPVSFIESLFLTEGDYIVLTSPSVDSKYFRRHGKYWRSFSPSHHLVLYSKEGIVSLFKECGISVLYYDYCISGSHGLAHAFFSFTRRLLLWPIRISFKGFVPAPRFHGRNSFLVIGVKK